MHWIVFMMSLYMYYTLYFVHIEHSVCHEPISILIKMYIYIYISPNLQRNTRNTIVRPSHPRCGDSQGQDVYNVYTLRPDAH